MPKDINGKEVQVGSGVKVIHIDAKFLTSLPEDEKENVASMLNEALEVYEIDEYNQAWVEKWWHTSNGESLSHSLALSSNEMELV
ncbi:MAG: hypothetical protein KUG78_20535 [Kangiellaceae bacterium]|nr:hypothetical protein [Kangiellaceae bacterium]